MVRPANAQHPIDDDSDVNQRTRVVQSNRRPAVPMFSGWGPRF